MSKELPRLEETLQKGSLNSLCQHILNILLSHVGEIHILLGEGEVKAKSPTVS